MNKEKKSAIEQLGISEEIYDELLLDFMKQVIRQMDQIDELINVEDREKIRVMAHTIKGTAGNLRLREMSQSAGTLETAVKKSVQVKRLQECALALRAAIEKETMS